MITNHYLLKINPKTDLIDSKGFIWKYLPSQDRFCSATSYASITWQELSTFHGPFTIFDKDNILTTISAEKATLLYEKDYTQPLTDLVQAGTLIDPDTDDDLEIEGVIIEEPPAIKAQLDIALKNLGKDLVIRNGMERWLIDKIENSQNENTINIYKEVLGVFRKLYLKDPIR